MRTHVYAALIATVAATTSATDLCLKGKATDIGNCTWDICKKNKADLAEPNCTKKFPLAKGISPKEVGECIYGAEPSSSTNPTLATC